MELDADSLLVLFDQLDATQQSEAVRLIHEYVSNRGNLYETRRIVRESSQRNSVKKMHLGPAGRPPCPMCGR
jgi:hypothetical protein